MSADALTDAELERLPVFPLPGVVFFPHSMLPLHVFEPRYLALTAHCLATCLPVGVPMIDPTRGDDDDGHPALVPLMGVGRIVAHERLPDGRYHILLRGVGRARLVEEYAADPGGFRWVRGERVEDLPAPAEEVASLLVVVRSLVAALAPAHPEAARAMLELIDEEPAGGVVADALASLVYSDPASRRQVFEARSVSNRLRRLVDDLAGVLAARAGDEVN